MVVFIHSPMNFIWKHFLTKTYVDINVYIENASYDTFDIFFCQVVSDFAHRIFFILYVIIHVISILT